MKIHTFLIAACFIQGLVLSPVYAQTSTSIAVDQPPQAIVGAVDGDEIAASAGNGRSYCCSVLRTGGVSTALDITSFLNFGTIVPVARGRDLPSIQNAENRYCWIEDVEGLYTAPRRLVLGNITTSVDALAWCDDTTLVGNYNTSVSEFNFLEVTARTGNTSSTINIKIRFKSSITGSEVLSQLTTVLDSATGDTKRTDISIHDLLAGQTDFGDIKITHDGAPGQVSARVSQYDVTSTSPLDFTLVGQDTLRRGSQGQ